MTQRTSVEEVLAFLGIEDRELLLLLRAEGLFEADDLSADECEDFRVAVHLMTDLGVNAAGVQVILRMRSRLLNLEERTSEALRLLLEEREGR
ncbi:MAG: hypothetical protein OEM05_08440 [Myxococcales bacterium]|nr:hypothetical protein [Myxococcales bacterium]